jgi:hypothetical protein
MVIYVASLTNYGEVLKVDTDAFTAQRIASFDSVDEMHAFMRAWNGENKPTVEQQKST